MKGSIEFGYHQANQSELSLKYSDILKLRSGAFDNPNSCFYSCNTGISDKNGSSFAQSWVNKVGGTTWAIYEKSDYANINNLGNWKTIIKPERAATGYRQIGSDYYPVPSTKRGAYWRVFTRNVEIKSFR